MGSEGKTSAGFVEMCFSLVKRQTCEESSLFLPLDEQGESVISGRAVAILGSRGHTWVRGSQCPGCHGVENHKRLDDPAGPLDYQTKEPSTFEILVVK